MLKEERKRGRNMEIAKLENVLYYDGIRFMQYTLDYPVGEESFFFAENMTKQYAAYLEGVFFETLCREYDAICERRKRYRHKIVQIAQRCRVYSEGKLCSVYFDVYENEQRYEFGFTWDTEEGIMMRLSDFKVKLRRIGGRHHCFYDGTHLYVFSKKGKVVEKINLFEKDSQK